MITHYNAVPILTPPRPGYLNGFIDSSYGSIIFRVTGNFDTAVPVVGGVWKKEWSRHRYSKRQPWNADGTKLLIDQKSGNPVRMVLDATTYAPLFSSRDGNARATKLRSYEVQWRPGHATQMVSVNHTGSGATAAITIEVFDISSTAGTSVGTVTVPAPSHTSSGALTGIQQDPFGWQGEGQISDDGRWTVVGSVFRAPQLHIGDANYKDYIVVVDLDNFAAGANSDVSYATMGGGGLSLPVFPTGCYGEIGNCGCSCLGLYAQIHLKGTEPGYTVVNPGYRSTGAGSVAREYAFILDINQTTKAATPHAMNIAGLRMGGQAEFDTDGANSGMIAWLSHSDFNIDSAGNEVIVGGIRGDEPKPAATNFYEFAGSNYSTGISKKYGNCVMINLSTGLHTHVSPGELTPGMSGRRSNGVQHTSGRATGRRGWHLISMESGSNWFSGEVMWVRLLTTNTNTGTRSIERLCIHRSSEALYPLEAHPVAKPDGSQVIFASNWVKNAQPPNPVATDSKAFIVVALDADIPATPPPDTTLVEDTVPAPYEVRNVAVGSAVYDTRTDEIVDPYECVRIMNEGHSQEVTTIEVGAPSVGSVVVGAPVSFNLEETG